jgi:ketosteroid isomerase-like protein
MNMGSAGDHDPRDILLAREQARRDALVAGDRVALAELLADDLIHVHTSGLVHGKAQLLDHAIGFLEFLDVVRGPLEIRVLGPDAAVMVGPMTNTVRPRGSDERHEVRAYVTQVWVREPVGWRISCFHAVRSPEASPGATA